MLTALGALLLGLVLLIWSADQFISGAIDSARRLGLSPMLIGLTLVAFGTSAPEVLVSVVAAITGAGDIAVGNAIGSNIANLGLVLGVTALIAPWSLHAPQGAWSSHCSRLSHWWPGCCSLTTTWASGMGLSCC